MQSELYSGQNKVTALQNQAKNWMYQTGDKALSGTGAGPTIGFGMGAASHAGPLSFLSGLLGGGGSAGGQAGGMMPGGGQPGMPGGGMGAMAGPAMLMGGGGLGGLGSLGAGALALPALGIAGGVGLSAWGISHGVGLAGTLLGGMIPVPSLIGSKLRGVVGGAEHAAGDLFGSAEHAVGGAAHFLRGLHLPHLSLFGGHHHPSANHDQTQTKAKDVADGKTTIHLPNDPNDVALKNFYGIGGQVGGGGGGRMLGGTLTGLHGQGLPGEHAAAGLVAAPASGLAHSLQ